jgi:hypothetical protein
LPRDVLSGSRRSVAKKGAPMIAHLEIGLGLLARLAAALAPPEYSCSRRPRRIVAISATVS